MEELGKKLLTDEQFVLDEIDRLRVLYKLKGVVRYHFNRDHEEIETESVAEHVYGMLILSRYFLPLEDPRQKWDRLKIDNMIVYHDIDEIETGDTIGYLKTTEHQSIEVDATRKVISQIPETKQEFVSSIIQEYFDQKTPESKFVRAIDKFEPVVHLLCEAGKQTCLYHKATYNQSMGIKLPVMQDFPYLLRVTKVASNEMSNRGFFTPEAGTISN